MKQESPEQARPPAEPQHSPELEDLAGPVTVLPPARTAPDARSTLIRVADSDQRTDHSGKPIPPVTAAGLPYRYKVRFAGWNAYACTADEVLALFIPDYRPDPPRTGPQARDVELEQVHRRGRHCIGVIVNHVAHAMLKHQLTAQEEQLLQRSAEFGNNRDPVTVEECPQWLNEDVPMLLMGDLYAAEYGRFTPPTGNVTFLNPGYAEQYLADLARLGLLALTENPAYTGRPLVEIRGAGA
jgi:hypothetical protein